MSVRTTTAAAPLAATTLRQQREHLRLAASILAREGEAVASLADLVRPETFKKVLRHYHNQANREPTPSYRRRQDPDFKSRNITPARHRRNWVSSSAWPAIFRRCPLTSLPRTRPCCGSWNPTALSCSKLYFLPEQLIGEVAKNSETGRVRFVEAQVAIAIDILLALPLRPQNLSSLRWRQHFSEPNGPRNQLLIYIAAPETKSKKQDIVSEVPDEVARRLRWYRRHILPRLGADLNGHLFVTEKGSRKSQATLTVQIIGALAWIIRDVWELGDGCGENRAIHVANRCLNGLHRGPASTTAA